MNVVVNGVDRTVPSGATVESVVELLDFPREGIAIAVDDAVVRRGDWATTRLHDGAEVVLMTAVQGG